MSEPRRITERYRLEKRVSSKDSGSVFRAFDTLSGEVVAVKLINTGDSEEERDLFERHLAALQGVRHPALPRILEAGFTTAGSAFLVTEFLVGDNLSELVHAQPARILALLLQLADGLEALAAHGLGVRSLSADNLWIVPGAPGPDDRSAEQVKILGLGGTTFGADPAAGDRATLRGFAELAVQTLDLPVRDGQDDSTIALPLHVAGSLTEPERLRELLGAALHGDPEGRFPGWEEVRRALRTALFGATGQRREARTLTIPPPVPPPFHPSSPAGGTTPIPRKAVWEEVRLGQGPAAWQEEDPGDTTMAVERLGPAPAAPSSTPPSGTMILSAVPGFGTAPGGTGTAHGVPRPAPPAVPDLTTRVFLPEELAPTAPASAPPPAASPPPSAPVGGTVRIDMPGRAAAEAGRPGTVRIPLKDIEEPKPEAAEPLRFPTPVSAPPPVSETEETMPRRAPTLPFPAPPTTTKPAPPPPPPMPPMPPPAQAAPAVAPPPVVPPTVTPPPAASIPAAPIPATPIQAAPTPATPAAAAPAPAPRAAKPATPGKGPRVALLLGIPAVLLLALTVGIVAWLSRRAAEPPPKPVQQVQAPKPKPAPPPVQVQAPRPVHAQILLAEESLNTGDLAAAKTALDAIPPEQMALFTSEEQDRYQRARDALTPLQSQQWDETMVRGLAKGGDLRLLRTAVGSPPDAATLTPEQKKNLARARKILDLDTKLSKAQKAKNHPDTLRQAGLLLAELPGNSRAVQARTQAADALLAEADARASQGQFDAALAALEHLREGWKDRPGLADRLERVRAEKRAEDQMEDALAAAARAERAERPREGLQALDRVRPNERYAERFQQARERLQAQVTQLDQNPPQIALTGPSEPNYEKGATVTVPLRIADDQSVNSVEAWVRPEGGRFTKTTVRHINGADYEIQIGPDLHQNKNIDFYVTATDESGHTGSLGSVQRPQKIKRKKWFDRLRGDKEGG
jgi:hypothetical protein